MCQRFPFLTAYINGLYPHARRFMQQVSQSDASSLENETATAKSPYLGHTTTMEVAIDAPSNPVEMNINKDSPVLEIGKAAKIDVNVDNVQTKDLRDTRKDVACTEIQDVEFADQIVGFAGDGGLIRTGFECGREVDDGARPETNDRPILGSNQKGAQEASTMLKHSRLGDCVTSTREVLMRTIEDSPVTLENDIADWM